MVMLQIVSVAIALNSYLVVEKDKCLQRLKEKLDLRTLPTLKTPNYETYFGETIYYVVQMKSIDYVQIINNLQRESYWNSRGRFLLNFADRNIDLNELFKFMAKLYIYNVIVSFDDGKLFTYFPYKYGNINRPDLEPHFLGKCDDNLDLIGNFYPEKLPILWFNTTLNVAYVYVRLYAMCVDCFARGIEFEILDIVKDRLKIKVVKILIKILYRFLCKSLEIIFRSNIYRIFQIGVRKIS